MRISTVTIPALCAAACIGLVAAPSYGQQGQASMNAMDHGPFVSSTITLDPTTPRGIIAYKAIAVRVAPDAVMAFDTDLLRVVGAWTGGLLHWYPARDALQEWPTPDGLIHFLTEERPGWSTGNLNDSRSGATMNTNQRYGPLTQGGRRYNGLYLHGEQVVFSFTVGGSDILELFGFQRVQEQPIFTRTINATPIDGTLSLHIVQSPEGRSTTLERTSITASDGYVQIRSGYETRTIGYQGLPAGAEFRLQNGHLVLAVPSSQQPLRFRLAIGPLRSGTDASFMTEFLRNAGEVQDLAPLTQPGPALWEPLETQAVMGSEDGPFAVDEITAPAENPWNSHLRFSAVDFLSDSQAAIASMSGDIWLVDGIGEELGTIRWRRFATGLNQPLGLKVVDGLIYVTGRDQITRLHDFNGDGHADFYENFNNTVMAATNFHAFTLNLETDSRGNFYFAKATPWPPTSGDAAAEITPHHGVLFRVSPDGRETEIIATGLRNPNGMSIGPNDEIYYSDNEGNWVPTSKVHLIQEGGFHGFVPSAHLDHTPTDEDYVKPIAWTPHFLENSPAQPRVITSESWPAELQGQLVMVSYGRGTMALILMEEVDGQRQAAHLILPLRFQSGLLQSRFHTDGHLYIAGMTNWQSTGHGGQVGSFHRVRYTGKPLALPVALHTRAGGIEIRFSDPLDPASATDPTNYSLTKWTYAWNSSYGSRQGLFSVDSPGEVGPDTVEVRNIRLSQDRRTVFIEIPGLEPGPVNARVPMLSNLPDQIDASLGVIMAIEFGISTADGTRIEQLIHKTIHRVPSEPIGEDAAMR
ncbi:MAG TPA: DUF6797 domain-containing protein [Longimicrobiales bacterium]|nr:DUF6797 domain-containing protein [Longimicrobiales bacterium]